MKTILDMALEAGFEVDVDGCVYIADWDGECDVELSRFDALVRADEREALIHYFNEHWRSDWSDGQIIEAIEARGKT